MIRRLFNACLLRPSDLQPSRDELEVVGVFNPGAVEVGDEVVLLARVAERPREHRPGFTPLPRWDPDSALAVDWVPNEELDCSDPREIRLKRNGAVRLAFISHLRVVRSPDGRTVGSIDGARFAPDVQYEEFGAEDPRITRIGDTFYFTYVAVSRHGAATALASTADFRTFQRHGIIFCPENKDVVLFPERIGGEYVALHRPKTAIRFSPPEIWLARSPDLVHWGGHEPVRTGIGEWETGRTGAGPPPVRTPEGWVQIYHGNNKRDDGPGVGDYAAGALLLHLEDPKRLVRQSREPILVPETEFERAGFVPNVIFPTGIVERDDTLLVYYGAADAATGVVEISRTELIDALD
jgi:predicted GH43/DUF377 family glycosyl hydrolase